MESGTKRGHYEISTLLGKGGMGEVWRARDTKLGQGIAIKMLPEEAARDFDLKQSGIRSYDRLWNGHLYRQHIPRLRCLR